MLANMLIGFASNLLGNKLGSYSGEKAATSIMMFFKPKNVPSVVSNENENSNVIRPHFD